jgi:DNA replication protein DnaC
MIIDIQKIQQAAGVPMDYIGKTVNDYEYFDQHSTSLFLKNILKYINNIESVINKRISLFINSHQPSTGKTFFAAVILNHALASGFTGKFTSFVSLKNKFINKEDVSIFENLLDYKLLVIDNIDKFINPAFLVNDNLLSRFEEFLEKRQYPVIFTSSAPLTVSDNKNHFETIDIINKVLKNNIVDLFIEAEPFNKKTIWDSL